MLPALLLALPQVDSPVSLHHFPADVPGLTRAVDAAWVEGSECYAVVHDSVAGSGQTFLSLSRADAWGSPLTAGEVLVELPLDHELTAGPVITDAGLGSGAAVAFAYSVDGLHVVATLWLMPGEQFEGYDPLEFADPFLEANWSLGSLTGWRVHDVLLTAQAARTKSIAIGGGDLTAYSMDIFGESIPIGDYVVAVGDEAGNVYMWNERFVPGLAGGGDLLDGIVVWVDQDSATFDSNPTIPRAAQRLVVWQSSLEGSSDVVARPYLPLEYEVGPRIEVLADPELGETLPAAAGDVDEVLVAARTFDETGVVHVVRPLLWDAPSNRWVTTGPRRTVTGALGDLPISGPALAMTAKAEFVHAAQVLHPDLGAGVLARPFTYDTLDADTAFQFENEVTLIQAPLATEHPRSPFQHGLVVWPGQVPPIGVDEARGARVDGSR